MQSTDSASILVGLPCLQQFFHTLINESTDEQGSSHNALFSALECFLLKVKTAKNKKAPHVELAFYLCFSVIVIVVPFKFNHFLGSEIGDVGSSGTVSCVASRIVERSAVVECAGTSRQGVRLSNILRSEIIILNSLNFSFVKTFSASVHEEISTSVASHIRTWT